MIFDRLVDAAHSRGETLASISQSLGFHVSSFYRWKKGSMPQPRTIRLVAERLRVREEWLRDGEEPRDVQEQSSRLSSAPLSGFAKEKSDPERLEEPPPVLRNRPPAYSSTTAQAPPAINAAAARLSVHQLEEMLYATAARIRDEREPLLKLGYLTTLKACVADLERRLIAPP